MTVPFVHRSERLVNTQGAAAPAAFRDALAGLLPRLRRFARTLVREPADADDLVQVAVERALRAHEQWNATSRLESWMFGIMRNAWIDEARARTRRGRVLAPAEEGEHVGETPIDAHIEATSVHEAMSHLPDEQRVVVALVLVEGLSYKEAAAVLEVPIGTVTSRLARARTALAAMLRGGAPGAGGSR